MPVYSLIQCKLFLISADQLRNCSSTVAGVNHTVNRIETSTVVEHKTIDMVENQNYYKLNYENTTCLSINTALLPGTR